MAKLKCSETYVAAARLGMQVLAGHGFATESIMSFRWRESIVATISGGTSQIQRNAIAARWACARTDPERSTCGTSAADPGSCCRSSPYKHSGDQVLRVVCEPG